MPCSPQRRPLGRSHAALAAVAVLMVTALIGVGASASDGATVDIAALPTAQPDPAHPVLGPDGNLWWTSAGGAFALQPDGTTVRHNAPADIGFGVLVPGAGGRLWFTLFSQKQIGYFEPEIDSYRVFPAHAISPSSLTLGPDGNMWYSNYLGAPLVRISLDGTQTDFPSPAGSLLGLAAGPDGALWFSASNPGQVGRIDSTTGAVLDTFPLPAGSGAENIVAGPDGNLWFVSGQAGRIGRVTTTGTITQFVVPGAPNWINGPVAGPDGNVWFTEPGLDLVGRITPTGVITTYPTAPLTQPGGIAPGPLGNLYFSVRGPAALGVVVLSGQLPTTTTTSTTTSSTSTTLPFSCPVSGSNATPCPALPIPGQPRFTG